MNESILNTTKKLLGLAENYDAFDTDVIININSVFSTLNDLGVGPSLAFKINDADAVWADFFLDQVDIEDVKTYMYLRLRLAFDPPATSFGISAFERQVKEHEWRLMDRKTPPYVPDQEIPDSEDEELILDGGGA